MKVAGAQLARFLQQPPADLAAVVLHGADEGLVKERAQALLKAVLAGSDDPFRVTLLEASAVDKDPARLADEAAQLSLLGGRRVVIVRDAGDGLAKTLAGILSGPPGPALIVIESGELRSTSALRKLTEQAPNAAAIACYPDGAREIADLVRETARAHQVRLDDGTVDYLVHSLGGDRLVTRQELEKLMLFAGDGGSVRLEDAAGVVGDTAALAIDAIVYDAFDGHGAAAEAGLGRLFLEGESPVTIVRAAQRHAQRLHLSAARVAAGEDVGTVLRGLRLFFKHEARFRAQLERWPMERTERVIPALTRAELDCKRTELPAETICRRMLSQIGARQ